MYFPLYFPRAFWDVVPFHPFFLFDANIFFIQACVGATINKFTVDVFDLYGKLFILLHYTQTKKRMTTTIYVVGENFCSYTMDAWTAAESTDGITAASALGITYEKVDCATAALGALTGADKTKKEELCAAAQGYPSFMDNTKSCTRGFKKCEADDTDCGYLTVNAEIKGKISGPGKQCDQ